MNQAQKFFILVAGCMLLVSCTAQVVLKNIPQPGTSKKIAILPFKDAPNQPGTGQIATEAFATELLRLEQYQIIERSALDKLLQEQQLSQTGLVDQTKAKEIGKLLGADAILYGAITEFKERNYLMFPPAKVSITARLIDPETGLIEWSSNHRVGGGRRWIGFWVGQVIVPGFGGIAVVILSPTAKDHIVNAVREISRGLRREIKKRQQR